MLLFKVEATDGFLCKGKPVQPREVLELDAESALDAVASGRARFTGGRDAHQAAWEAVTRQTLAATRPARWPLRAMH